jgi:hypothetical protein
MPRRFAPATSLDSESPTWSAASGSTPKPRPEPFLRAPDLLVGAHVLAGVHVIDGEILMGSASSRFARSMSDTMLMATRVSRTLTTMAWINTTT